jgi:hypothetical protein
LPDVAKACGFRCKTVAAVDALSGKIVHPGAVAQDCCAPGLCSSCVGIATHQDYIQNSRSGTGETFQIPDTN